MVENSHLYTLKDQIDRKMESKRIEIFVTFKKHLASIGFSESNSALDKEQHLRGSLGVLCILLSFVQLIHVASTAREYMESIIAILAGVGTVISSISMHYQFANIFLLMDDFERLVNESEYTIID